MVGVVNALVVSGPSNCNWLVVIHIHPLQPFGECSETHNGGHPELENI